MSDLEMSKAVKLPSRFNLYDTLAYILVGISAILLIRFDLFMIGVSVPVPELTLANLIIWLAVYYFLGTTIQEIARLVFKYVLRFKVRFSDYDIRLLDELKALLSLKTTTLDDTYKVCYLIARAKDVTGHVDLFHALYALYRGWVILFFAESVFLIIYWGSFQKPFLFISMSVLLMSLFFIRCRYFFKLVKERILHTFFVLEHAPVTIHISETDGRQEDDDDI